MCSLLIDSSWLCSVLSQSRTAILLTVRRALKLSTKTRPLLYTIPLKNAAIDWTGLILMFVPHSQRVVQEDSLRTPQAEAVCKNANLELRIVPWLFRHLSLSMIALMPAVRGSSGGQSISTALPEVLEDTVMAGLSTFKMRSAVSLLFVSYIELSPLLQQVQTHA